VHLVDFIMRIEGIFFRLAIENRRYQDTRRAKNDWFLAALLCLPSC